MPILRDFERRLGNLVEGFFATTFRSGLQPVELAKRLLREMDTGKTVGVHGMWAPNRYIFLLSRHDAERFEQAEQALVSELKQVVRDGVAERGWGLVGPPEVEFEIDETLAKGRFRCEASLAEGEPEPTPPPSPAAGSASIVVYEDARAKTVFHISKQSVTIGRLPECDVVIRDPGASRRHARIRVEGADWMLTDLGSTNGTLVNDVSVGEHLLSDGDRITIGTTILEFRRA